MNILFHTLKLFIFGKNGTHFTSRKIFINVQTNKPTNPINFRNTVISCLTVIFSAVILLFVAFYNGYPLVYPDTGTYIRSGFEFSLPVDRPIYYGLFVRHFSLATSLWYVIFIQGLVLSHLVFLVFKEFFKREFVVRYLAIIISILVLFTGASFNVSMLTPDLFTSYLFLSFYLLLFGRNLTRIEMAYITLVFIFSLFTHNSHLHILFITIFCIGILYIFRYLFKLNISFEKKRLRLLGIIFCFSIILIPTFNFIFGNKFIISEASHVFLIHKLHDDSILEPYLQAYCQQKQYYLCEFKDSLPWDLIWDARSPITQDGNWNKYKTENNQIIFDILTTYKYSKMFFLKSIHQTFKQLFSFNTGDAPSGEMCKPAEIEINNHFKDEKREFLVSRQLHNRLSFDLVNSFQTIVVLMSLALFAIVLFSNRNLIDGRLKLTLLVLIIFQFSNAFVCSTFSNVLDRYQSRIIWLIPIFALVVLFQYAIHYIEKLNLKLSEHKQ